MSIPRPEYPRPQFERDHWLNLNGPWEFAFDDDDSGLARGWHRGETPLPRRIVVPFAYQSRASGIGDGALHDVVWYRRSFDVPAEQRGRRAVLHFGAVDYRASVWVNGELAAVHEGGHVPFSADVTRLLRPSGNTVVVRAEDPSTDKTIPRGKQYWRETPEWIFYTRTTGIWQTVWLEFVPEVHLAWVRFTPDIDRGEIHVEYQLSAAAPGAALALEVAFDGAVVAAASVSAAQPHGAFAVAIPDARLWHPDAPHLYDATFTVGDDRVRSYFGMRKVHAQGHRVFLNNLPFYSRLVLDQGYWPESLMTPPSDEALRYDVEMTRRFGFNGARKHQKVEDPRYLYWADRLGLVVWGEMASTHDYSPEGAARFVAEWCAALRRDYNHPCIVAWTPHNESWGVPRLLGDARQAQFVTAVYHLTRALDPTRLVSGNDGWEQTATDIAGLHDYALTGAALEAHWREPAALLAGVTRGERHAFVPPWTYAGQPLMISEWGGIKYAPDAAPEAAWGYQSVERADELVARYDDLVAAIQRCPAVWGHCYTQLTDVEQEVNGLMTYDRRPKVDPDLIRALNERPAGNR